jgi:hypothetical protein
VAQEYSDKIVAQEYSDIYNTAVIYHGAYIRDTQYNAEHGVLSGHERKHKGIHWRHRKREHI